VETVHECYETLGVIHALFRPVPGRLKDYIGMPKANMYQSIHTTVIGHYGERLEIQIRTREMHRVAEEGIAAHWSYKEHRAFKEQDAKRFTWLKQMVDLQKDLKSPQELLEGCAWSLSGGGLRLHAHRRGQGTAPGPPPWWTLPMPSIPRWEPLQRRQGERPHGCPCAPNLQNGDTVRSSPRRITSPAGTGCSSSRPPRPGTRSPVAQGRGAGAEHHPGQGAAGAGAAQVRGQSAKN